MTGRDLPQRGRARTVVDTGSDPAFVAGVFAGAGGAGPVLLEREAELRVLAACFEKLGGDDGGGVVLVEGPAGIGKTALMDAALATAPPGALVLRATGRELESDLGFGTVRELLCPHLRTLDPATRGRLFSGPAGYAAALLGAADPSAGLGDPLFGLYWLVVSLAEQAPLILAVDDLHWVDAESARFLAHLAARCAGLRLAVLAASRPLPNVERGPLRAIRDSAQLVHLAPLSVAAVATLIPGTVGARAHEMTGGNPLLVREIARVLNQDLELTGNQVTEERLATVFLDRLHRLPPPAVDLARVVSLFADQVPAGQAGLLADLDGDELTDAVDTLVGAAVLTGRQELHFAHPVLRTAVHDEMSAGLRSAHHRRIVELLRSQTATDEEILPHLMAAAAVGDRQDTELLLTAAREAELRRSPAGAARCLTRLLAEPAHSRPDDATLLARLGALQAQAGDPAALHTLRRALAVTPDSPARWDLAVLFGKVACEADPVAGTAVLTELRAGARVDRTAGLAVDAVLAQCAHAAGDAAGHEHAVARLPRDLAGDTEVERLALAVLAARAARRGEPARGVCDLARRSLRPVASNQDVGSDADDQADLLVSYGDLETGEAVSAQRAERAAETGCAAAFADAQLVLTVAATVRGNLVGAEAAALLGLGAGPPPRLRFFLSWRLAEVLLRQGRLAEVDALGPALFADAGGYADRLRGEIALLRGEPAVAAAAFDRARVFYRAQGYGGPAGMGWTVEHIEALARTGRQIEAGELAAEFLAGARVFAETRLLGLAMIGLGALSEPARASTLLTQAQELLAPSPHRFEAALAGLHLSRLRRRLGQRAAARALVEPALVYAETQQAAPLAEALRTELTALGVRPRRRPRTGPQALTAAQDRVARLAADGLTNKQIAQRSFLTVKTVEMHLSAAFRVLGITSRTDLLAALQDLT